jgi:hypothetical protein
MLVGNLEVVVEVFVFLIAVYGLNSMMGLGHIVIFFFFLY